LVRAEYGYPKGSPKPTAKEEICHYSPKYSARLSAHPNDIVVDLMVQGLLCKTHSKKPQEALNQLVTEDRYPSLIYTPLYTFLHNLLNGITKNWNVAFMPSTNLHATVYVFTQFAELGLQKTGMWHSWIM
jgi:hypothetical protein